jgi:DNA primase small subunit
MNTDTKVYLKKRLKEYYWNHQVAAPAEVHRREFGVGTFDDKIKFRHKSFATEKELNQYLKTEAPYYISYSAAYYEFPSQEMAEKCWLGADLIFDLDKPMELLNQARMDEVKTEAIQLIDFLREDFGFSRSEISANFSGGKGYHIHVTSDDVKTLNGDARRDIIDYITGTGLDIAYFMREGDAGGVTFKRGRIHGAGASRVGPKKDSTGWAKRIYDVTEELISMPTEELEMIDGIGPKTAQRIAENREKNMRYLAEGRWDALLDQLSGNIQRQIMSKTVAIKDADKQVTLDTARLIRLPDTIHGGSGLLARRVKDLDSFNPLTDAVAFKGGQMDAKVVADVGVFQLNGKDWGPYKAGERISVDECARVYLMLKDKAETVGG